MKEIKDVKYKVIPEEKKVVCILTVIPANFADNVDSKLQTLSVDAFKARFRFYHMDSFFLKTYAGVAVCHPDDTFDEQIGKDIAYRKAYAHWYSDKMSAYDKLIKNADFLKQQFIQFRNNERETFKKNQERVFSKLK